MSEVEVSRQLLLFGADGAYGSVDPYDIYWGLVGYVDTPPGDPPKPTPDYPWWWGVDWQKMPDTLSGKPFPIWATGVSNGLVSHYHVDQIRWLDCIAILGRDSTLDIDLIDDDGVPLVDPAVPPVIVARMALATDTGAGFPADDYISDNTSGTWSDAFVNMPLNEGLTTKDAGSWRLRLNRSPVPHWRITVSTNRIEATPSSFDYRYGFRLGIVGNYSGPHTDYTLAATGSPWDVGRVDIALQFQASGGGINDVQSLDVVNGSAGKWATQLLCRGAIDVAASSSGTLYPRTPTGLIGGAAVYSVNTMPMVRVLAQTNAATTTPGSETTWVPGSIGLGANDTTNPPFRAANINTFGFYSELSWDAVNSEWKLVIHNENSTTTKSFYSWWLGV